MWCHPLLWICPNQSCQWKRNSTGHAPNWIAHQVWKLVFSCVSWSSHALMLWCHYKRYIQSPDSLASWATVTCSYVCDVKKIMNVYYNSDFVSLFVNLLNTPARMTSNNFLFLLHPAYLQMEFHFSSVSVLHLLRKKFIFLKGAHVWSQIKVVLFWFIISMTILSVTILVTKWS